MDAIQRFFGSQKSGQERMNLSVCADQSVSEWMLVFYVINREQLTEFLLLLTIPGMLHSF